MQAKFLVLSLCSLQLMSCATAVEYVPYVYKIDVNQGNVIDQAMIDQLRPNMTKKQVLYIMGSPMLVDFFHQDRWDYVYAARKGSENLEQKNISIFFENDQLKNIQGDFRPSAQRVLKPSSDLVVDVPKRDLDQTWWGSFTSWLNYDGTKKDVEPLKQQSATP